MLGHVDIPRLRAGKNGGMLIHSGRDYYQYFSDHVVNVIRIWLNFEYANSLIFCRCILECIHAMPCELVGLLY